MIRHIVYLNVSIIAGIVATLAVSPVFLTTNPVSASLSQKKDVSCAGEMHTQNYCDGYHLGRADVAEGDGPPCAESKYRGDEKSHTKDWRDGYNHGWESAGCEIPA
jgi:hypothetical protein